MGQAKHRDTALDGLRGIAAVSVVFYHSILHRETLVQTHLFVPVQAFRDLGDILLRLELALFDGQGAVLLFFVLSGFVLRQSLGRSRGSFLRVAYNFAMARVWRLYPAMFFCMAAFLLLAWIYALAGWPRMVAFDPISALRQALLVQIWWHGPSTTVRAELLAVPFLLLFFVARRSLGGAGLILILAYSAFAFIQPRLTFNLPDMSSWLFCFAVGFVLAEERVAPLFQNIGSAGMIAIALVFLFGRAFVDTRSASSIVAQAFLAGGLVAAVHYSSGGEKVREFLRWSPINLLGRISYSFYLLNVPVLFVIWSWTDGTNLYEHPSRTGLLVGLVATLATIPLAAFAERFVERPGIAIGRRLLLRSRADVAEPSAAATSNQLHPARATP